MKAYSIVAFGEQLEPLEVETPKPVGREVLVKVRAAGVGHSDIHIWEGGYDLGHGRKLSLTDRGVTLPRTLGHETVGEVVAMGPDATGVEIGKDITEKKMITDDNRAALMKALEAFRAGWQAV